MKIDLTELLIKVGNEADLETTLANDQKSISVRLHLVNTGASVLINGTAETEVEAECGRCLENFRLPLKVNIKDEYSKHPAEHAGLAQVELKEEDFVYPIEKDNTVDLSETIRQNLLLALPIKLLCRPDCKGINQ